MVAISGSMAGISTRQLCKSAPHTTLLSPRRWGVVTLGFGRPSSTQSRMIAVLARYDLMRRQSPQMNSNLLSHLQLCITSYQDITHRTYARVILAVLLATMPSADHLCQLCLSQVNGATAPTPRLTALNCPISTCMRRMGAEVDARNQTQQHVRGKTRPDRWHAAAGRRRWGAFAFWASKWPAMS